MKVPSISGIIWTRSRDHWVKDRLLFAEETAVFNLPCIYTKVLKNELDGWFTDVIVTSPLAAECMLELDDFWAKLGGKQLHVFGNGTFEILRNSSLDVCFYDVRTASDMAPLLPVGRDYLQLGPKNPAYDFAGILAERGSRYRLHVLYEVIEGVDENEGIHDVMQRVLLHPQTVACFASPSAVRGFLGVKARAVKTAVAIGPTTALSCQGHFTAIHLAKDNSLASLAMAAQSVWQVEKS